MWFLGSANQGAEFPEKHNQNSCWLSTCLGQATWPLYFRCTGSKLCDIVFGIVDIALLRGQPSCQITNYFAYLRALENQLFATIALLMDK